MNRQEQQFLVYKYLVDKMLKPHNVDLLYVIANPKIEDVDWFKYYTWTNTQRHKFAIEATDYVQDVLHLSKRQAAMSVGRFLSNHGLKVVNQ